jgi:acetyl-CoA carboxylase biotin carboxyl carrier protein
MVDGDALRAPAPGYFHRLVAADHVVAPGDVIGELDVLGRIARVVAPDNVRGLVVLDEPEARRAVSYGDVLLRLGANAASTEPRAEAAAAAAAAAARAAAGHVFRAPTSGRFFGRPAPDKPPFVAPGTLLEPGAVVCLLEVMKTFHRVAYAGEPARVREVLVADGADVNAGDPLVAFDQ